MDTRRGAWPVVPHRVHVPGGEPPHTIEYSYLDGAAGGGPTLETREGWDIDGREYKAREGFTATPVDHRGLVKNPGQIPTS